MKIYRFFAKVVLLVLLCLCSWTFASAQANASGASVSRSRAILNSGPASTAPAPTTHYPSSTSYPPSNPSTYPRSYPPASSPPAYTPAPVFRFPEEVAVEEFVNYHKHRLPLPKAGQAIALDTRWGNSEIAPLQREAVLQIGFTTSEINERTDLRISSVAKNVQVRIEYGPGLRLEKIYGYTPRYGNGHVTLALDDMNNGLTQVVMAKFRADSAKNTLPVKVRLTYYDVKRKCMVDEVQELRLVPSERESCDPLVDLEVKKNQTIAELADSLFQMTALAGAGNYSEAQNVLDASVATAHTRYPYMEDEDIRFIFDMVEGYRRDLRVYNQHSRRSDCGTCR